MKSHKWKRKQDKQRRQNPTRNVKIPKLLKYTREIAIQIFNEQERGIQRWWMYGHTEEDMFMNDLMNKVKGKMNISYEDILLTYPLYKRCLKELQKKKEKAEFINKVYKPLAEDLFEI